MLIALLGCSQYIFVLWIITHVLPLEEHVDLPEGRSTHFLSVPAFNHQVKDLPWTVQRSSQVSLLTSALAVMNTVFNDLVIAKVRERLLCCQGQNLPQSHCEGPDVTFRCKFSLQNMDKSRKVISGELITT